MIDALKMELESFKKNADRFSILYVEDEKELREKVSAFFGKFFKHLDVASDGKEGLEKYKLSKYDIVITDIQMPNMNGIEMIRHIREINEQQEVIVISAYADSKYFTECIQLGVTGYIVKPINFEQVMKTLNQSVTKINAFYENEMYKTKLETMVQDRTEAIFKLRNEQFANYEHAIHSLVKMVEARDSYTGGHSERVATYSRDIAKAMGLSKDECTIMFEAGILHDIGKIVTPDAILLKPGRLSEYEYSLIKDHVTASYNILREIPMYEKLANIVYAHHEHYDGSGYPRGIKYDEIPLMSRIMSVADAFDAMTTSRIYKKKKTIDNAIKELKKLSGTWYDSAVVQSAVDIFKSVDINNHVGQEPSTLVDDERFAYFYKDPLTNTYNHNYLDFLLKQNAEDGNNLYITLLYMKDFSLYNKNNSWSDGDKLLNNFSNHLKSEFPDTQIFRIFGDDFVLLQNKNFDVNIDKINSLDILKNNNVYCESRSFELQKDDIKNYKDLEE